MAATAGLERLMTRSQKRALLASERRSLAARKGWEQRRRLGTDRGFLQTQLADGRLVKWMPRDATAFNWQPKPWTLELQPEDVYSQPNDTKLKQ